MFKSEIKFNGRNRRPPRDPVNVMLSLGYTLLTKEITALVEANSFEIYIGFLHGIQYGRKTLPLDLVEEFRAPVIDRLVLYLFNKRIINENDFEYRDINIVLKEEGFEKFIRAYEKWMTERHKNENSFRSTLRAQIGKFRRAIHDHAAYVPYKWGEADVSGEL